MEVSFIRHDGAENAPEREKYAVHERIERTGKKDRLYVSGFFAVPSGVNTQLLCE